MKKTCLALIFAACFGISGFAQTPTPTPANGSGTGRGIGDGEGSGKGTGGRVGIPKPSDNSGGEAIALRLVSKPRPVYTQEARENEIQGTVRLRVAFLASGEIGSVSPISSLPYGLTEQAIAAAKQIKFEPATRGGVPVSTMKTMEYSFMDYGSYYSENDKSLKKRAEVLEMPAPELSPDEINNSGGKIKVSVLLDPQNGASLNKPNRAWSKELTGKIREAVVKIKFNPATDQNDDHVTQLKEIEYAFPE